MGTVLIITRKGLDVIDTQEVTEDQVPAILDHIDKHHPHEGLTISVVPVGWSWFLV